VINLLSDEVKKSRRYAKLNVITMQYVMLFTVATISLIGLMLFGQSTLNDTKSRLEDQLATSTARAAALEPINNEAQQLSATVSTIGTLLEQEVKFSVVLQELGSIIPPGVVLTGITLSQDTTKPMVLEVNLSAAEKAGVLQQNLTESDLFVGADIINVTQGIVPGYPFRGQLQAYFNPDLPLNTLDDAPAEPETQEQQTEEEVNESQVTPESQDEQSGAEEEES
jgi:Tfp pilus assembly protein PilN